MTTVLNRPLRRLLTIDGQEYVLTIDPEGLRLVPKGKRKGTTIPWQDILSGTVTLDAQLLGSLTHESDAASEPAEKAATARTERGKPPSS